MHFLIRQGNNNHIAGQRVPPIRRADSPSIALDDEKGTIFRASPLRRFKIRSKRPPSLAFTYRMASWRSGYAEDCKSLHPGSIPGEASIHSHVAS